MTFSLALVTGLFVGVLSGSRVSAQGTGVKNIVLVHGAFADGSGWQGVFKILTAKGYNVTVVQNPCSSMEEDVAAVTRALDQQDGPVILVGHSYGGAIITQAGVSSKVVGLVYVAAFQPDMGESALSLAMSAPPLPEAGINPPDANGLLYYAKDKFHGGFCADLSASEAAFMWASQVPVAGKAFGAPMTEVAWKSKPSWGVIPSGDKSINPIIEHRTYERSHTTITEVAGASHVVFISHPEIVAGVIEKAAKTVASGSATK